MRTSPSRCMYIQLFGTSHIPRHAFAPGGLFIQPGLSVRLNRLSRGMHDELHRCSMSYGSGNDSASFVGTTNSQRRYLAEVQSLNLTPIVVRCHGAQLGLAYTINLGIIRPGVEDAFPCVNSPNSRRSGSGGRCPGGREAMPPRSGRRTGPRLPPSPRVAPCPPRRCPRLVLG